MWLVPDRPALVLAPMEGVFDAVARAVLSESGAFAWCVAEFVRVARIPAGRRQIIACVPELAHGARTPSGTPVQVQILGNRPEVIAETAVRAVAAGATAIDLNFGCPGPLVTGRGGGAALLRDPPRIVRILCAVREAVAVPVSAKIRLGWNSAGEFGAIMDAVARGGASWATVHARTRAQQYDPGVDWTPLARVGERWPVPVIANGDLFSADDIHRCAEATGCRAFMMGRGAIRDPALPAAAARVLGLPTRDGNPAPFGNDTIRWRSFLERLAARDLANGREARYTLVRVKQWMAMARLVGFDPSWSARIRHARTLDEAFDALRIAA